VPKHLQPELDSTDRAIIEILAADARITNQALADAVGVAPSTALHACARSANAA